jgi:hypothetical protein
VCPGMLLGGASRVMTHTRPPNEQKDGEKGRKKKEEKRRKEGKKGKQAKAKHRHKQ